MRVIIGYLRFYASLFRPIKIGYVLFEFIVRVKVIRIKIENQTKPHRIIILDWFLFYFGSDWIEKFKKFGFQIGFGFGLLKTENQITN